MTFTLNLETILVVLGLIWVPLVALLTCKIHEINFKLRHLICSLILGGVPFVNILGICVMMLFNITTFLEKEGPQQLLNLTLKEFKPKRKNEYENHKVS